MARLAIAKTAPFRSHRWVGLGFRRNSLSRWLHSWSVPPGFDRPRWWPDHAVQLLGDLPVLQLTVFGWLRARVLRASGGSWWIVLSSRTDPADWVRRRRRAIFEPAVHAGRSATSRPLWDRTANHGTSEPGQQGYVRSKPVPPVLEWRTDLLVRGLNPDSPAGQVR